jgi:hypothetical protein
MKSVWAIVVGLMLLGWGRTSAQTAVSDSVVAAVQAAVGDSVVAAVQTAVSDSVVMAVDSLYNRMMADSAVVSSQPDSLGGVPFVAGKPDVRRKAPRDWNTWRPDPKRALWLALVIPGGGQIYNRKYWKLPIVYGGFLGCIYAMRWNNMMYRDYSQAYLDLADNDPTTASYNQFLHLGQQINDDNKDRYLDIFRRRKDKYRRWRDLSFFVMVGVYALSVIDAYVDAELSDFDISKDLSMKVRPTVMGNGSSANPIYASSVGVNCSINF